MFQIPKDMVGRRLDILVPGITTIEIKITSITEDEVVGTYADGEECHVNHRAINVWWPATRREISEETKAKMKASRQARTNPK